VDDRTPAEQLPSLYRAVLDTVARLEHLGERAYAFDVRRSALRTYSTRWDEGGRHALVQLNRKARVRLAGVPDPAARSSLVTSAESA
jgi:hypothetical protein